ncbi:MAG: STAS domain-containing protein [Planctomycetota bacterium]
MLGQNAFPVVSLAANAARVTVSGKLRGRHARQLGSELLRLADEGITRVVLDLRELTSIDSLGTYALEEGLDHGVRIHLVVPPTFRFDRFFSSRALNRRGLRVHRTLEQAVAAVRDIVDSGVSEGALALV